MRRREAAKVLQGSDEAQSKDAQEIGVSVCSFLLYTEDAVVILCHRKATESWQGSQVGRTRLLYVFLFSEWQMTVPLVTVVYYT